MTKAHLSQPWRDFMWVIQRSACTLMTLFASWPRLTNGTMMLGLKDVAEFGAERTLGIGFAYMSSKISDYLRTSPGIKGNLKRQGVVLTVPSHKKQTRMVHLSPPSWKGGHQQNSGTSMSDGEDNMDLDLDLDLFLG